METKKLAEVARILGQSRYRIEQWIARGQFLPKVFSDPGKPREWTLAEVMRLGVFIDLVNLGFSPEAAGIATQTGVHGFKDDTAFLVVWDGLAHLADDKRTPVYQPGHIKREIIPGKKLAKYLSDPEKFSAAVVNLDNAEARVRAAWEA